MDDFLENGGVIRGSSTREKTRLKGLDNIIQKGSQFAHDDLGDDIIKDITKADETKSLKWIELSTLGTKEINVSELD